MLRSALSNYAQTTRTVASSSSKPTAQLHTSAPLCIASERRRQIRAAKQRQNEKRKQLGAANQGRPHVILGHRPGDEVKWAHSDLAKIIVTEEQIHATTPPSQLIAGNAMSPSYRNFGIGEKEEELLFNVLPALSEESSLYLDRNPLEFSPKDTAGQEVYKTKVFAALIDLRNANAGGITFENKKRIIEEFSRPGVPNDSGLPEVQAAILTMRIRNVWDHLGKNRKDVIARRNLRQLVHQRAKVLKYLKRLDRDRYDAILGRLGLEAGSVEGELVV